MKNKRGQVTIFIIIAIVIVAGGILVFSFWPQIKSAFTGSSTNPEAFIQECVEDELADAVELVSLQGGSANPTTGFYTYEGSKIEYLCYQNQAYASSCVVQQPFLKQHIESEIETKISDAVNSCFNSMQESFEKKGYDVSLTSGDLKVELLPGKVVATMNRELTLTKGDSERYDEFVIVFNNKLYEFVAIANSIIDWESEYGDCETTVYMGYYHWLVLEKLKQTDGTKIYILKDKSNEDVFKFASRSRILSGGEI